MWKKMLERKLSNKHNKEGRKRVVFWNTVESETEHFFSPNPPRSASNRLVIVKTKFCVIFLSSNKSIELANADFRIAINENARWKLFFFDCINFSMSNFSLSRSFACLASLWVSLSDMIACVCTFAKKWARNAIGGSEVAVSETKRLICKWGTH